MDVNIIACIQGPVSFGQRDGVCTYLKKNIFGKYKCKIGNKIIEGSPISFDSGKINCRDKETTY